MKLRNKHGALMPAETVSTGSDGIVAIKCVEGHELAHNDGTVIVNPTVVAGHYVINARERLKEHLKTALKHPDYTWRTLTGLCIATGLTGDELERDYLPAVKARKARDTDRRLYALASAVGE